MLALQKGMVKLLMANSSIWSVPAVHHRIFRQYKKLCFDTVDECVKVATRQVCAANAAIKDHITAKADIFAGNI